MLNESQQKTVAHESGHLLIIAGPGTGKTHTLTHRIACLTQSLSTGQKILAVTFTNKAAEEMRERLTARLDSDLAQVTIGTFHSFCLQILREFADRTHLPKDFKVALPEDIAGLVKDLWPKESARERKERLEKISRAKSNTHGGVQNFEPLHVFDQFLRSRGLIDFDDILGETLTLLTSNTTVADSLRRRYGHICVDEYQDINPVQNALLKELVQDDVHITAIGDPNQAIYGFRGSDVKFFDCFDNDFPGAQIIRLNENYRSTANLIKAGYQMISVGAQNSVPLQVAKIFTQGQLIVHAAATDRAESEYVVHQIEKLVGGTSMFSRDSGRVTESASTQRSFGDIAVLYRLKAQTRALKDAFERSGIPYHVAGEVQEKHADADAAALRQREESLPYSVEKVSLMTLHAAKGLEFPVVFIVGCEENLLPLNFPGMTTDPGEERRLLYVGMTRAKEQLYLTRAGRRLLFGQTCTNPPSPFLSDIEEDLKAYAPSELKKKRIRVEPIEKQMELFGY